MAGPCASVNHAAAGGRRVDPHACVCLQVTALSELVVEVWGLPSQSMFSSRRGSSSTAGLHGKADGDSGAGGKAAGSGMGRRPGHGAAGSSGYGSEPGSLPSGSVFLGAVHVSTWLACWWQQCIGAIFMQACMQVAMLHSLR